MTAHKSRYRHDDDFYIGYKSMPVSLRGRHRAVAIAFVVMFALAAVGVSSQQKSSGSGVWQASEVVTVEGLLVAEPYPLVQVVSDEGAQSVLLIQPGKHSANALATAHAGKMVAVSGYAITRGGWRMLEVPDTESIVVLENTASSAPPSIEALGNITLDGEVVGSKCFLGVMKPGDGPVHRACAELCLLGGVPPMFVARDSAGDKYGYLLVAPDGSSLSLELAAHSAVPVRIQGELQQRGDLLYIQAEPDDLIALDARLTLSERLYSKHHNTGPNGNAFLADFSRRNGENEKLDNDMCST